MNKEIFRGKSAVIDIGSNSVRLMFLADGNVLYKALETTRLGEGIAFSRKLKKEAEERTAAAVAAFFKCAQREGAKKIFCYATAAVREAENGAEFVALLKNTCGALTDVLPGEEEAALGTDGALKGTDGATVDIGGASTEIAVRCGGKIVYKKSVRAGVVRIKDFCRDDAEKIKAFCEDSAAEFDDAIEAINGVGGHMVAIGGTATTIGAMKAGLKEYDGRKVTGVKISCEELNVYAEKLLATRAEEIEKLPCMPKNRADVIGGGAVLLSKIAKRLGLSEITVSDEDGLEGYARKQGLL